jgi:NitT/TauT family transport system permease protein
MNDSRLVSFVLPITSCVIFVLFWNYSVQIFHVPAYLIPTPMSVLEALWTGLVAGTLWPHIVATSTAMVLGYIAGCSVGLVVAAAISEFKLLRTAIYPLIIGLQSMPKVALAPVLVVWFGFDLASKVVLVGLLCFFPTFVNAVVGFESYDRNLADLYETYGASKLQILLKIKLPSALGQIFAGLEISVVLALLGAVVAELVAARRGLGYVIQSAGLDFNTAVMFACVLLLAVMGMIASQLVILVRRRLIFWEK